MAGMAGAGDDAPGTPPPPSPQGKESPLSARFFDEAFGVANDAEQIAQDPEQIANDAYLMSLRWQESERCVNLKGQAARDYYGRRGLSDGGPSAGVSFPCRFAPLSEIIGPPKCRACKRRPMTWPPSPFMHRCFCETCREDPCANACCRVCGAGRSRFPTDIPRNGVWRWR